MNETHGQKVEGKEFYIEELKHYFEDKRIFPKQKEAYKEVGGGAFQRVYIVKENETGKIVAVRALRRDVENDEEEIAFLKEISIASKFNSFFIVRFLYFCPYRPRFSVFEAAKFNSLDSCLFDIGKGKSPVLSPSDLQRIAVGICFGLREIHSFGVIHRDMKLKNVLLDDRLFPKICDFGAAIHTNEVRDNKVIGTPAYIAPEILNKKSYDEKIDIYSLGIMLYEMSEMSRPYNHLQFTKKRELYSAVRDGCKPVITMKTPAGMADLIMRCIDHDPSNRPSSDELLAIFHSGSVTFRGVSEGEAIRVFEVCRKEEELNFNSKKNMVREPRANWESVYTIYKKIEESKKGLLESVSNSEEARTGSLNSRRGANQSSQNSHSDQSPTPSKVVTSLVPPKLDSSKAPHIISTVLIESYYNNVDIVSFLNKGDSVYYRHPVPIRNILSNAICDCPKGILGSPRFVFIGFDPFPKLPEPDEVFTCVHKRQSEIVTQLLQGTDSEFYSALEGLPGQFNSECYNEMISILRLSLNKSSDPKKQLAVLRTLIRIAIQDHSIIDLMISQRVFDSNPFSHEECCISAADLLSVVFRYRPESVDTSFFYQISYLSYYRSADMILLLNILYSDGNINRVNKDVTSFVLSLSANFCLSQQSHLYINLLASLLDNPTFKEQYLCKVYEIFDAYLHSYETRIEAVDYIFSTILRHPKPDFHIDFHVLAYYIQFPKLTDMLCLISLRGKYFTDARDMIDILLKLAETNVNALNCLLHYSKNSYSVAKYIVKHKLDSIAKVYCTDNDSFRFIYTLLSYEKISECLASQDIFWRTISKYSKSEDKEVLLCFYEVVYKMHAYLSEAIFDVYIDDIFANFVDKCISVLGYEKIMLPFSFIDTFIRKRLFLSSRKILPYINELFDKYSMYHNEACMILGVLSYFEPLAREIRSRKLDAEVEKKSSALDPHVVELIRNNLRSYA